MEEIQEQVAGLETQLKKLMDGVSHTVTLAGCGSVAKRIGRCEEKEVPCEKESNGGACARCKKLKYGCNYSRYRWKKSRPMISSSDEQMDAGKIDYRMDDCTGSHPA